MSEEQTITDSTNLYDGATTWEDLSVPAPIIELLCAANFRKPTKTQVAAIKPVLIDKKLSGIIEAPTGTGKTISFLTLAMSSIAIDKRVPQVVIIAPTKLLCKQIYGVAKFVTKGSDIGCTLCLAETEMDKDTPLDPTAQIVIGTTIALRNRFAGKITRKGKMTVTEKPTLDSLAVSVIIIDEADFFIERKEEVSTFLEVMPKKTGKFLYSATMPVEAVNLMISEWLDTDNPYFNERVDLYLGNSIQFYFACTVAEKSRALDKVVNLEIYQKGTQSIIFCETKKFVDECYEIMTGHGYQCSRYHSDLSKSEREKEFAKFKSKESTCLITTSGLARGIDIASIRLVINYSPPTKQDEQGNKVADPIIYTHRIGRGGRFGRATVSITLCEKNEEKKYLDDIVQFMDKRYTAQKRTEHVITPLSSVAEIKEKVEGIMRKVDREIDEENQQQNKKAEKRDDVEDVSL